MDRREHHRVQLRIPARLRWTTPLGQRTEICETLNVSRAGLLVPCKENYLAGTPLWITFPYDATLPFGQPEVLARVVRSELVATRVAAANASGSRNDGADVAASAERADDRADGHRLGNGEMVFAAFAALQFEAGVGAKKGKNENGHGNGNGHHREVERRTSARRMVAVPIRVRLEHVPWFEETMTIDASNQGLRFVSSRQYEPGQHLIVSFEDAVLSPWPVAAEFRSLVVRADPLPQGPALAVTIYRVS
jgi:hypothetical protein